MIKFIDMTGKTEDEALAAAVKEAGYEENAFTPAYRCPLCEDTGMRGGIPCSCVAEAARRLRREELRVFHIIRAP